MNDKLKMLYSMRKLHENAINRAKIEEYKETEKLLSVEFEILKALNERAVAGAR